MVSDVYLFVFFDCHRKALIMHQLYYYYLVVLLQVRCLKSHSKGISLMAAALIANEMFLCGASVDCLMNFDLFIYLQIHNRLPFLICSNQDAAVV